MASRYTGSRYDGDSRRSRSRERSPDRRSLYSDSGPRRSSAESRSNAAAFQTNRDSFRDTLPRDTPRGPKALLDPPSGPRGGGYSGDFRGRGRGRGRGWRDDSRDRGRDRDLDFRDRRDASYRDDRSRERERPDWRDRDRDSFRGRRPSSRPRSPPGRDFRDSRDSRDGPLGVDADRARRGSRDGPLSAGSSSSDPPFAHSSYRGDSSYRGYGRGRGRGRGGDWDRGRGRPFYDDRDRYGPYRSRSNESRFRDRDDHERDSRYADADLRSRGPRDDRDVRDRETRPKLERTSHEPPASSKDVSPPPVAPAAPSFGSVPNRTALATDVGSATGKPPPTGPRALKDERVPPVNPPPTVDTRGPPTGPSKPSFMERSPPMPPLGPRSQRPGPSSKQWINPNLKHKVPESPKLGRSSSFVQSRPAGFRPDGAQSNQPGDSHQYPGNNDTKADFSAPKTEDHPQDLHVMDLSEDSKIELRPRSADSSTDQDKRKEETSSVKIDVEAAEEPETVGLSENIICPAESSRPTVNRQPILKVPVIRVSLPERSNRQPILDQSSESDEEEFGDVIETEITEVEKELKQLDAVEDSVSMGPIVRYALISLEAVNRVASQPEGLEDMVGPIPETPTVQRETLAKPDPQIEEQPGMGDIPAHDDMERPAKEDTIPPSVTKELVGSSNDSPKQPQPSIEQEADAPAALKASTGDAKLENDDGDVTMEDVGTGTVDSEEQPPPGQAVSASQGEPALPSFEEAQISSPNRSKRESSTPSPPEDEDETDIEDVDLHSIAIVREHIQTPPLDSLPNFDEKPWDKDKSFIKSMNTSQPDLNAFILRRLKDEAWSQQSAERQLKKVYSGNYDNYIRFTMSNDPVAVKSREKFSCVLGISDSAHKPVLAPEPKPEHTRRSRYASERDLERVLEESRKAEDEKREREQQAEREKYRTDKEAVIPRQYQTEKERENEFYRSNTGFVQPEKIVATWEVLPPIDNFAEEESAVFEKAYLEFPKQWGRVSEPLSSRDFGTSIQFYYLKKEKDELNLKAKLKKQPKKRKRGRGKMRSSALVSELGNGDNDNEEPQETGENGERRRPRRAAAPTFNSEATPATDGEGGTPAGTPGRRGATATRADGTSEKPKRGRRAKDKDKDKEPKQPRVAVPLAAAPTPGPTPSTTTKGNRSRSASRVQGSDWAGQSVQDDTTRPPPQHELPSSHGQSASGIPIQSYPQAQPLGGSDRTGHPASMPDVMAPPPLRPEPPPPPQVAVLDIGQPAPPDRKSGGQPSSYWSVPEAGEFPSLLKSFGSDWAAIASHMRTKTAVMVKNYYTRRKDTTDWEAIVKEADERKHRGEKQPPPPPPVLTASGKKRYDASNNRPLAAADAITEDAPTPKVEHTPANPSMNSRFNVPIAAQPPPPAAPFVQTTQAPPLMPSHLISQVGPQPISQPTTQTMSPVPQPLRAPPFPNREPFSQQPSRTPLVSKPPHAAPSTMSESPARHPLPGSHLDPQPERQKPEPKVSKDLGRQQERQPMRVKQEPDLVPQHEFYTGPPTAARAPPPRVESMPLSSRSIEASRGPAQAPQPPYVVLQHQPGRGFMSESTPSSPIPPRPIPSLPRPLSSASGTEPYNAPPAQRTPPSVAPAPPRAPKTSSLMALLNDDPPAPPKRVAEVPAAPKPSSTPPPHANLSRPPPPPPPPSHVRREPSISETQSYGYSRNPPPPPPSSMPSLKPYSASPQTQSLNAPRHMPLEGANERDYYGSRSRPFPPAASSPQNTPHYQPPTQPPQQVQYQSQTSYPYGTPIQAQPPNASSPPPQYAPHQSVPRSHESSSSVRETVWPPQALGHPLQPHHQHQQPQQPQPPQQQQQPWSSHPPQPPKPTQPQPTQSAWAAQHASTPKPPQPSNPVQPQPSWVSTPAPRTHDPLRDIYAAPRMQPPLPGAYPPSSRAPEPPPQGPSGYARYTSTPVPGRDPRDPGPPRSYTPYERYPPQGPELRDAHLREQQQQQLREMQQQQLHEQQQKQLREQQQQPSVLQQQLRPQDRQIYDRPPPPPDRYGR